MIFNFFALLKLSFPIFSDLGVRSFELKSAIIVAQTSFAIGMGIGGVKMAQAAEATWKKTHYHSLFMNNKDYAVRMGFFCISLVHFYLF